MQNTSRCGACAALTSTLMRCSAELNWNCLTMPISLTGGRRSVGGARTVSPSSTHPVDSNICKNQHPRAGARAGNAA